ADEHSILRVMVGLGPTIRVFSDINSLKSWMAGTRSAMTGLGRLPRTRWKPHFTDPTKSRAFAPPGRSAMAIQTPPIPPSGLAERHHQHVPIPGFGRVLRRNRRYA